MQHAAQRLRLEHYARNGTASFPGCQRHGNALAILVGQDHADNGDFSLEHGCQAGYVARTRQGDDSCRRCIAKWCAKRKIDDPVDARRL